MTWFNPLTGALSAGEVTEVNRGGTVGPGRSPTASNQDWAVVLRARGSALFADRFEG